MRWLVLLVACSSPAAPPAAPSIPELAEPAAPVIECDVRAEPVHCEPGERECAREKPASKQALGGTGRLFSAMETRRARAKQPDACCYLEWTWMACD